MSEIPPKIKWHGFWEWLANGSGGKRGISRLIGPWNYLDVLVGVIFYDNVISDQQMFAKDILLPVSGVFIGISVSSVMAFSSLMTSKELTLLSSNHSGGLIDLLYALALAVLLSLTTLIYWVAVSSLSGLSSSVFIGIGAAITCLSVRMAWRTILGFCWFIYLISNARRAIEGRNTSGK